MDITTLAQGGAAGAFVALALYLVKVIVNDMKHDITAMREGIDKLVLLAEQQEKRRA